jgi:hypothetical protein
MSVLPFLVCLSLTASPQEPTEEGPAAKERHPQSLVKLPDDFVRFVRVPEGGTGASVATGNDALVVLFFKGTDLGDLYLTRSQDEGLTFSPGVRISREPSAVRPVADLHVGAVALAADGTAHVSWIEGGETRTVLYARVLPDGTRSLPIELGTPRGLCSNTAVAVNDRGDVFVVYAGIRTFDDGNEAQCLWLRRSQDGMTFGEPIPMDPKPLGVSEESALSAFVDRVNGTFFVMYRTAFRIRPDAGTLSRGMRLISSEDRGETFDATWVDNWKQVRDPRSSAGLSQESGTTLATWDSGGQVFWSLVRRQLNRVNIPMDPRVEGEAVWRTNPSGAAGGREIFLTWLECPEKERNGPKKLVWGAWMREGRAPIGRGVGPADAGSTVPVCFPRKSGGFIVLY